MRGAVGMGGGDPKLVAAIGCWTGWQALPLLLLLASAGGIGWAVWAQRKGDRPLAERRVPFGVFLCTAAFAAVPVWRWLICRSLRSPRVGSWHRSIRSHRVRPDGPCHSLIR